jgi:two-component system cell cycle response regulator DivK
MNGPRVLIVEDNPKNLKLARDVLAFGGFTVLEATDGASALAAVAAETPDVVLMDIQLPDMSGVDVLCRLREDERTRHIPVVALTAFAMREDRQRFACAGFDGYISKPIDVRQFANTVRRFCHLAGTAE